MKLCDRMNVLLVLAQCAVHHCVRKKLNKMTRSICSTRGHKNLTNWTINSADSVIVAVHHFPFKSIVRRVCRLCWCGRRCTTLDVSGCY